MCSCLGVHLDLDKKKKKNTFPLILFTETLNTKNDRCCALFFQKQSFGLKFASQVVILRGVFDSHFSKSTVFIGQGTPRKGPELCTQDRVLLPYGSQNPKCQTHVQGNCNGEGSMAVARFQEQPCGRGLCNVILGRMRLQLQSIRRHRLQPIMDRYLFKWHCI